MVWMHDNLTIGSGRGAVDLSNAPRVRERLPNHGLGLVIKPEQIVRRRKKFAAYTKQGFIVGFSFIFNVVAVSAG